MREAARKVADAVRSAGARRAERESPGRYRATVVRWTSESSFALDLHGADLALDDDDVSLGQTVRRYNADSGIARGDVLVLLEMGDGDFVAVEIESDH